MSLSDVNVLQALAIYKNLSTEPPVPSTESEVATHYTELDYSKESTNTLAYSSSKHRAEEAAGQDSTKSIDSF